MLSKITSKSSNRFYTKMISMLLIILLLLLPIKAFALNLDYLDNSTWNDNPNVTSVNISGKSGANKMQGIFRYYFDNECAGLYTYFNVSESTLSEDDNIVKVHYDIYNDSYAYSFSIDEDGIVDFGDEEYKYFNVYQSFQMVSDDAVRCMTATEFNCKPDTYTVDIKLHINGRNYNIMKGYVINTEKPTTTKESTTKQTTTKHTTTKQNTTKKSTTEKSTTNKAKKESTTKSSSKAKSSGESSKSTTKFKATGSYIATESNEVVEVEEDIENAGDMNEEIYKYEDDVVATSKTTMSKGSKIMLIAGIIVAVIAFCFIIVSVFKPKSNKEVTSEGNKNIEE